MSAHEGAEILSHCLWAEKAAGGVVGGDLKPLQQHVGDGHARAADGLHDFAAVLGGQDLAPVVVVHRADDALLLEGLGQLGLT